METSREPNEQRVYNWEPFNSNEFFMLFQSDGFDDKFGFDIELTCQKPIQIQYTTLSGEKLESVHGTRT